MSKKELYMLRVHREKGELMEEIRKLVEQLRKTEINNSNAGVVKAEGVKIMTLMAYYEFKYGE